MGGHFGWVSYKYNAARNPLVVRLAAGGLGATPQITHSYLTILKTFAARGRLGSFAQLRFGVDRGVRGVIARPDVLRAGEAWFDADVG